MQLGYEPGPVTVKGPGWTSAWGLLGKNEPTRYRAGVLTGYLRQANITDNLTTGLTMSICEVVASSCVQVRRVSIQESRVTLFPLDSSYRRTRKIFTPGKL